MDRPEIALAILCAMLQSGAKVSTAGDDLGQQQIQTAFALADTFIKISNGRYTRAAPWGPGGTD